MEMPAAEEARLLDGCLVVDSVDDANHICLQERSAESAIRLSPEVKHFELAELSIIH